MKPHCEHLYTWLLDRLGADSALVYRAIESRFPAIGADTRFKVTDYSAVSFPVIDGTETHEWVNAPGLVARFWRAVGLMIKSPSLFRRGQMSYTHASGFVMMTIHLESLFVKAGDIGYRLKVGYSPDYDFLAIRYNPKEGESE